MNNKAIQIKKKKNRKIPLAFISYPFKKNDFDHKEGKYL